MTGANHPQQGMALIEALVASAVLGIGLLGATQLTLKTQRLAGENRQHTNAQRLAQEGLDCLVANTRGIASPCPAEETIPMNGVHYKRQTRSTVGSKGHLQDLQVRVIWPSAVPHKNGMAVPDNLQENILQWNTSVAALPAWVSEP